MRIRKLSHLLAAMFICFLPATATAGEETTSCISALGFEGSLPELKSALLSAVRKKAGIPDSVQIAEPEYHNGKELGQICISIAAADKEKKDSPSTAKAARDPGPEEMILKTSMSTKPSKFPHRKHQEMFGCEACHHSRTEDYVQLPYTPGMPIEKCIICHNPEFPDPKLNSFKKVGHARCKNCHKTEGVSTKCILCHKQVD